MQFSLNNHTFEEYLYLISEKGSKGFEEWLSDLNYIIKEEFPNANSKACLVINANPFTTGHEYLINLVAKRVQALIVFVIQGHPESGGKGNHENTGIEFSADQRLEMTKQALKNLNNVLVLPSGPYLISRNDYPTHFLKEELSNASAHAILDSMVFCQVCKAIGAKTAFAGDEPRDELSEIHLNALRTQCLENNIILKVAERKRLGDKYISSSMVREALSTNNWDLIKQIVPPTTYDFLCNSSSSLP